MEIDELVCGPHTYGLRSLVPHEVIEALYALRDRLPNG